MSVRIYKKKDGSISTIKKSFKGTSFSYGANGQLKGSSFKHGDLTTFNDAAFNPNKYGLKLGDKTKYYNSDWKQYK